MNKIKKYIFCLVASLIAVFILSNKRTSASEFWDNVEVVFNADSNGKPTYVYEREEKIFDLLSGVEEVRVISKQYAPSRDLKVSVYFVEDITDEFSSFDVCEIIPENTENNTTEKKYCSSFEIRTNEIVQSTDEEGNPIQKYVAHGMLQLRGVKDGEKKLSITFSSIGPGGTSMAAINKSIILDTTSPVLTLEGGEYIYLASGEKYSEPGYKCEDTSEVIENSCSVSVDGSIDLNKPGYQYVMYTVRDFLGNETNITRKVMVEVSTGKSGISLYWVGAGILVIIVAAGLTYVVLKNKEKQRNQSVL